MSTDHNPTQKSVTVWLRRDLMERFQAMAATRGNRKATALAREILTREIEAQERA